MDEEVDASQLAETFRRVEHLDEVEAAGGRPGESLTRTAARGIGWTWFGVAVSIAMQITYTAVMSRLVAPAAFGLVAAALVGLRFVSYLANFGLGRAVVQRRTLGPEDAQVAFGLSVAIGVLVALLSLVVSPILAAAIDQPEAVPVMRWLAVGLFVTAITTVPDALLHRAMRFRAVTLCQMASFAGGYLGVGIPLAVRGWGVWSLVAASLTQSSLLLASYWIISRMPVRWRFDRKVARELLTFGGTVSLTSFLDFLGSSLDTLAVGRWIGAGGLGQYTRGAYLVALPVEHLNTAASRVLLPAFSRVQDQKERFTRALVRSAGLLAVVVMLPVAAGACAAPALVPLVLGSGWEAAARVLPILAVAHGLSLLTNLPGIAAESKGEVRIRLVIQAITLATIVTLVALVVAAGPSLVRFAWCWLLSEAIRFGLYWLVIGPRLGVEARPLVARYSKALVLACAFAAPTFVLIRLLDLTGLGPLVAAGVGGTMLAAGVALTPVGRVFRDDARAIRSSIEIR